MEELMLVNPSKRPRRRKTRRTAAQRAATARLVAANRARRTRRTRRAPVTVYASNPAPRRRRRHSAVRHVAHRVRRATRRYRRNPSPRADGMLMPAFQGALGATAVNTLLNYIPLPASLTTGNLSYVTRAVASVGLGMLGGKIMPGRLAHRMAVGSLTVVFHDAIKDVLGGMAPSLKLGYVAPGMSASRAQPMMLPGAKPAVLNEYLARRPAGMGAYMTRNGL